jgi:uncharacterized membrane protein
MLNERYYEHPYRLIFLLLLVVFVVAGVVIFLAWCRGELSVMWKAKKSIEDEVITRNDPIDSI